MEQIFFLVLLAVVGLVRWILQAAEEKRNAEAAKRAVQKQPNAPIERAPAQSEEERVRRFMEALGVPPTTTPAAPKSAPPPMQPPKAPERKRKFLPVDPFPIPRTRLPDRPIATAPPPVSVLPAPIPAALPPHAPVSTTSVTNPVLATSPRTASEFEVAEIDWQAENAAASSATAAGALVRQDVVGADRSWAARLATPESLRDAIVLREIFGAPRSLQALDDRALA
jgi:hypothetical protein